MDRYNCPGCAWEIMMVHGFRFCGICGTNLQRQCENKICKKIGYTLFCTDCGSQMSFKTKNEVSFHCELYFSYLDLDTINKSKPKNYF